LKIEDNVLDLNDFDRPQPGVSRKAGEKKRQAIVEINCDK